MGLPDGSLHPARPTISNMKTNNPIPQIVFSAELFQAIQDTIGKLPPESGGMFGGSFETGFVNCFHFDDRGKTSCSTYSPDASSLNLVLEKWNAKGDRLMGYPHSHPHTCPSPSGGDEVYAAKILATNKSLPYLLIPIVITAADTSEFKLNLFVAQRAGKGVVVTPITYQIQPTTSEHLLSTTKELFVSPSPQIDMELFARVVDAYDLVRLSQCRVILIGTGGAAAFGEDLARAGVGQIVLVDPGHTERCNLATQNYYAGDVGKPKVRCLARRIRAVNPNVKVLALVKSLHDIDDIKFEKLAFAPLSRIRSAAFSPVPPLVTVIVGATDDFFAQARVNRLALKFGLPSVCAQNYKNGLAGEATFTHPQTTASCHRCILSTRYAAYLEKNFKNDVGSAGSPISSTVRLNELKFMLVMAILHHGTEHQRWGNLLERIGNRNFVQVRNHPDAEKHLGLTNFTEAFAGVSSGQMLCGEMIFRPQTPEHPTTGYPRPCPDCGGLGDLGKVKGQIADTRELPRS